VVLTGVRRIAVPVICQLGLAVGQDQGVLVRTVEGDDLPVERAAVKSCDCHVLTLTPRADVAASACRHVAAIARAAPRIIHGPNAMRVDRSARRRIISVSANSAPSTKAAADPSIRLHQPCQASTSPITAASFTSPPPIPWCEARCITA